MAGAQNDVKVVDIGQLKRDVGKMLRMGDVGW